MKIQNLMVGLQDSVTPSALGDKKPRRDRDHRNGTSTIPVKPRKAVVPPPSSAYPGNATLTKSRRGRPVSSGKRLGGHTSRSSNDTNGDYMFSLSPPPSPLKTAPVPLPQHPASVRLPADEADTEGEEEKGPPAYSQRDEIEWQEERHWTDEVSSPSRRVLTSPLRSPTRDSAGPPLQTQSHRGTQRKLNSKAALGREPEARVDGREGEGGVSRGEKMKMMRERAAARVQAKKREDDERRRCGAGSPFASCLVLTTIPVPAL